MTSVRAPVLQVTVCSQVMQVMVASEEAAGLLMQ